MKKHLKWNYCSVFYLSKVMRVGGKEPGKAKFYVPDLFFKTMKIKPAKWKYCSLSL